GGGIAWHGGNCRIRTDDGTAVGYRSLESVKAAAVMFSVRKLERIPVIWKHSRRVGKAKRAHQSRAPWARREERAFAHPTSDSSRSKSALTKQNLFRERCHADLHFAWSFHFRCRQ